MWQSSKPPSFTNDSSLFTVENMFNSHNLNEKLTSISSVKSPDNLKQAQLSSTYKARRLTPTNSNNPTRKLHNPTANLQTATMDDSLTLNDASTKISSSDKALPKKSSLRKDIQSLVYHSHSEDEAAMNTPKTQEDLEHDEADESVELDLDKDSNHQNGSNSNKLVNVFNCNRGVQAIPSNQFDFIWDQRKQQQVGEEEQLKGTAKKIEEHVQSKNKTEKAVKKPPKEKGPKLLSDDFKYVRNPEITIMLNLEKKKNKKLGKKKAKSKGGKSGGGGTASGKSSVAGGGSESKNTPSKDDDILVNLNEASLVSSNNNIE